jgi:hypothetical protein
MTTYAKRADINQAEIVQALRQAGRSVQPIYRLGAGVPDLLCGGPMPCPHCGGHFPQNKLLEVKRVRFGALTPDEATWHQNWRGQVEVARTIDEALKIAGVV